jgi:hypothetical protein
VGKDDNDEIIPELAMHIAMTDPNAQVHTAVAGPPTLQGTVMVAGTDPSTPRMDMAYDTVDHLLNSRFSSYKKEVVNNGMLTNALHKWRDHILPDGSRVLLASAHRRP